MTARLLCILILLTGCAGGSQMAREAATTRATSIIPAPASMTQRAGEFQTRSGTRIVISGAELSPVAEQLAALLRAYPERALPVVAGSRREGDIELRIDSGADTARESYRLEVRADGVLLTARTPAGIFRGTQTLRQLVQREGFDTRTLVTVGAGQLHFPAVSIVDAPRFSYRGMHLDVGRHLFPVDFIKRYIDLLALYKFNTFHWHLTEDQGWRIQIMKYPRLTEVGAWRKETILDKNFNPYVGDGKPYGGFYTQDEVREIVAYAAARYITVIPEIEMPGHSVAALAAYPELGCTPGPFEVHTRWGVTSDIFCPHERTFSFLEDVLTEVMQLFPSTFVHIGGDEAPKDAWKKSAVAQEVIRREGLKDEHELQSWFIRRIERFLNAHGRRLIGWDEILEGGLAPNATVMSWRGTAGGVAAANEGHDVIMTPTSHMYFDYYQGRPQDEPLANGGVISLEKVYAYEPIPAGLSPAAERHILGAQGNVWTEYMKTSDHVEYMVLPRMLALAEVVWSPRERRNWADFQRRLPTRLAELSRLGYRYRRLDVTEPARN